MTPTALSEFLPFCIQNRFSLLLASKPGCGKSEIVDQAVAAANVDFILSHPIVADPTDYKGLPFLKKNGKADFIPFGDLERLIEANTPTVFFLDDLGQASISVQAACMQLILARRINGHKISKYVTFFAATNRAIDKSGVNGMIESLKGRFEIIDLDICHKDWIKWGLNNNMPTELINFIRFRPNILDEFKPSKDIVNTVSPRTIANAGRYQAAGLKQSFEFEVFKGAAGIGFATEYTNFLNLMRALPAPEEIILNPTGAILPTAPDQTYAISCMLAKNANDQNIGPILTYLDRLAPEYSAACMKDATTREPIICKSRPFIQWASDKADLFI